MSKGVGDVMAVGKRLLRIFLGWLFRIRLIGGERLKINGPAIILPNHVSFIDAVLMYAYLPDNVWFVVNTAIAAKISFILKRINHIMVDPHNPYALKRIIAIAKEGHPIVLFPEGRITTTGNLMKIYSGVGFIALKAGAVLYPVTLLGPEYSKLSRIRDKVKKWWFPQVTMYLGQPVSLQSVRNRSFRQQKREMSDKILTLMQGNAFSARRRREITGNLFNKLLEARGRYGADKTMAQDGSGSVSYRKAIIGSYILGNMLRGRLCMEETVGIMLPNSIGHVIALFALSYIGKTAAILNFSIGAGHTVDCLKAAGIRTVVTARTFVERGNFKDYINELQRHVRIIYLEDVKANATAKDKIRGVLEYCCRVRADFRSTSQLILFTSGSESKPKGVVLHHTNIISNINQISSVIAYTTADRMLNALPMFHSFGLTAGTLLPILSGIEVYLYPTPLHYKMIPEVAYDWNATILLGTPTFLAGYAKQAHQYDFYSLRYVVAGGEPLKEDIRQLWQEKFGLRILEGYGTTETAPVITLNTPLFNRKGTVGRILPGIEWKLRPVEGIPGGGSLMVRGPNVMRGYILAGTGFVAAPEWYDTGDVASVDDDGYVTIHSRLKRFAKVSGEMLSLDAVEDAARACFGGQNAVISIPDANKGEKVILYTQNKAASRQTLREYYSRMGISMLALPAEIAIIEKLPTLANGKIDYVTLRLAAEEKRNG